MENKQEKIITQTKNYKLGKFLAGHKNTKFHYCTSVETETPYAAKVLSKEHTQLSSQKERIQNEITVHRKLHHPNIVKFAEHFEDEENIYILFEYYSKNNLKNYIKKFGKLSEKLAKSFAWQLLLAIRHLHDKNIVHRDIKLGNILISSENEVKLGNFGLAAKLKNKEEMLKTVCGSCNYLAPEILDNDDEGYSFSVDIWAFGIVLYTLVYGVGPFKSKDVKETYRKIKEGEYSFPEGVEVSEEFKELIEKILLVDPADRAPLEHIENHEFFNGVAERIPKSWVKDPNVAPGVQMKFHSGKNVE